VRLKFRDNDCIEAFVPNDLLSLLDRALQITPPDFMDHAADFYSTHVAHGDDGSRRRWHRTAKASRGPFSGPFQTSDLASPSPNFRATQDG